MFHEVIRKVKKSVLKYNNVVAGDLMWYWPMSEKDPVIVMTLSDWHSSKDIPETTVRILHNEKVISVVRKHIYDSETEAKKISGFTIPGVRQIFPSMIANEIVSVSPMNLPSGLLSYMNNQYQVSTKQSDNEEEEGK